MALGRVEVRVDWYAAVRSTELSQVESLASDLRERGGQHLFSHLVSPLAVNSVLVIGKPTENPLVRVHSNCLTGDVFGSQRCDCGPQLAAAIKNINEDTAGGYIVYMAGHEGEALACGPKRLPTCFKTREKIPTRPIALWGCPTTQETSLMQPSC